MVTTRKEEVLLHWSVVNSGEKKCVSDHTRGALLTGQSVIKMASDINLTGKPTVPDEPGRNVTKIAFLSALGLTREVVT